MAKRFIGIDTDGRTLRIAVASGDKGETELVSATRSPYSTPEEMLTALREAIGGAPRYGDRMAAALATGDSFVRWLQLPFSDPKKIESALGFELSGQLPVTTEDCTTDFQKPIAGEGGGQTVPAAAVRNEIIGVAVAPFDAGGLPLQTLDIASFAHVAGLRGQIRDGILVTLSERELIVGMVSEGRLTDYRLLPAAGGRNEEELVRFVLRESRSLRHAAGAADLPLFLIGSAAAPALAEALRKGGEEVNLPSFSIEGRPIDPDLVPAAALAMRAAAPEKEREFNFRRGVFALKNEWAALKKGLIAAAVLLVLSGSALAGAAYLGYSQKAERAEALKEEMVRVYKELFPRSTAIVDIPLQMRSGISELRKRTLLAAGTTRTSPLAILQEISRSIPQELTVDIRDLTYTPDSVRLEGSTSSFDAINQIARSLEQSSHFEAAQISDAKMSLDGSRVDFRMNLSFSEEALRQ